MTIRDAILVMVEANQGLKGVDLVVKVMSHIEPHLFNHKSFDLEIDKLISEGKVVEMEYILKKAPYAVKSIYFPEGTSFRYESSNGEEKV